jgi:hypothetical protein
MPLTIDQLQRSAQAILDRLPVEDAAVLSAVMESSGQRRRRRDDAIRATRAFYPGAAPSRVAKDLAADLADFVCRIWPRLSGVPSPEQSSPKRAALRAIVELNGGTALGWRQILEIIEI